ncbi:histone H2A deubiquitinase MYSM1 [Gouania willdenowi]|nr:histone H2A deubiquitinase MYSM1 [Gouania willdenowi]
MEDDVDVDIEGEDFEGGEREVGGVGVGLVPGQFSQSAERSGSWVPWELDSSISAENREVIQRMLLEEQYYLTGKEIPEHIWDSESNKKPKEKKSHVKSTASASGSSSRWSKEEKEQFEKGLAQFGRRWTKIAKLMGSRTVLQVKSYARQYFKHKAKSEHMASAPSPVQTPDLQSPVATPTMLPTLANAIRIEKPSDDEDEDVDITDDDGDKHQAVLSTLLCESREAEQTQTISTTEEEKEEKEDFEKNDVNVHISLSSENLPLSSYLLYSGKTDGTELLDNSAVCVLPETIQTEIISEDQIYQYNTDRQTNQQGEIQSDATDLTDYPDKSLNDQSNKDLKEEEEQDEDDEEEELKAPEQEVEMDMEIVTEDEKQAIPEFFEGRPSKTPERYLKIRNYILDQWLKSKPKYLNKTSVRPGLKNCGDVNCIGRIHTYLELIGAINFNCDQAVYNRPKVVDRSKHREGTEVLEAYQLAQRLQNMRTRKRRVRDVWGNWCDSQDAEGQTYMHLSAEELALRKEELKKQPKPSKMSRDRECVDPFQLIPCRSFKEDVQEPFQVIVCAETLLIIDMHAHVSRAEVIGLLGGTYNDEDKVLKIRAAEPCNSVSTGLQCEMDPLSQTQACDVLSSLGLNVVGWYHSHPSFHPNPSVRDISTQDQFQSYFSRGGAPFIGVIVSPYDPANSSPFSQTTCLLVKESHEPSGLQKLPYRFDFQSSQDIPDWEQTFRRAQWIIHKYAHTSWSMQMDGLFRRDSHLTCLEKMLMSLARYLEPLPDEDGNTFLTHIRDLFQTDFISKLKSSDQEENTDDPNPDRLVNQEKSVGEQRDFKTSSSPVLHLGSVLSTEHDYLL